MDRDAGVRRQRTAFDFVGVGQELDLGRVERRYR
jgi:hypothetical protein